MKDKILKLSIENWNNRFGGTSAISIAEKLNIEHKFVQKVFKIFAKEGKGKISENVELGNISVDPKTPGSMSYKKVNTTIFFPSKKVLTNYYYNSDLAKKDYPEYKKRLHIGHSQIELCYFSISVLKKYQDHLEKYDIVDSNSGGYIRTNFDYTDKIDDTERITSTSFGKRKIKNESYAVVVFLKDLSKLPEKEQSYWHSHELDSPNFNTSDKDFHKFYMRFIEGVPAAYKNPIDELFSLLSSINQLLIKENVGKLFTKLSNPYLTYPVNNTYKNFSDSLSELYKIIGPDGNKKNTLKKILKDEFKMTENDFKHEDSDKKFSSMELFKLLVEKLNINSKGLDIIEDIKNHRIEADHKVTKPKSSNIDYIGKFRRLIEKLNPFYKKIENKLSKRVNAT